MAHHQKHHSDDTERVLIKPSACSTFVVKKSSFGHVPHEPSKGAVGHDVSHSAVPSSASTAAHGGLRVNVRPTESKQNHSVSPRHGKVDNISPSVQSLQCDVSRSLVVTQALVSDVAASRGCDVKSSLEEYRTSESRPLFREAAQMSKFTHRGESSSTVSLSDLVEDESKTGLFPGTSRNRADDINPASSGHVAMLETEVVTLREQLIVQSKVSL